MHGCNSRFGIIELFEEIEIFEVLQKVFEFLICQYCPFLMPSIYILLPWSRFLTAKHCIQQNPLCVSLLAWTLKIKIIGILMDLDQMPKIFKLS